MISIICYNELTLYKSEQEAREFVMENELTLYKSEQEARGFFMDELRFMYNDTISDGSDYITSICGEKLEEPISVRDYMAMKYDYYRWIQRNDKMDTKNNYIKFWISNCIGIIPVLKMAKTKYGNVTKPRENERMRVNNYMDWMFV